MSGPVRQILAMHLTFLFCQGASTGTDAVWSRVSDGKIAIYTKDKPSKATPLLKDFSQLRRVVSETSGFAIGRDAALKVIAFQSESEFNPYRLNEGSCAFYQQTHRGEYIVLQDLSGDSREIAAHEFTHFLLAHSGVNLPLWLNEGLADFYSTFEVSGDKLTLGRSVTGRLSVFRSYAALPLETLFQIGAASSYYSDPERMALFYSESWLLTHMLLVSPQYSAHFPDFLRALKEGRTGADAFQTAYGKTPAQAQPDLVRYLSGQHLPLLEASLQETQAAASPVMISADASEIAAALGDLGPHNVPSSEESLGYQALEHGQTEAARVHFRLAVERNSDDPNVLFYLAHLDHEAGVPSNQVLPLLDRALRLQPNMPDARLELALLAANEGDFQRALAALQKLSAPRPENAYAAIYTEAYCYAHVDQFAEARAAAERARLLARNDRDRAQVNELVDFIIQQSR
jgi:Flp pilus assembly protein TadD